MTHDTGNAGFTYVGLLVTIAIIGIFTAVVGQSWKAVSRIEKERELLWVGHQFRQGIKRFYEESHQGVKFYPMELADLLEDPRSPAIHRYIRRIYKDPMTGKDNTWVLVFDSNHRIKGVHSASDASTLKRDNFDLADASFRGKTRYSDWVFAYEPVDTTAGPAVVVGGGGFPNNTGWGGGSPHGGGGWGGQ